MGKKFYNLPIGKKTILLLSFYVMLPAFLIILFTGTYLNQKEQTLAREQIQQSANDVQDFILNYLDSIDRIADHLEGDTRTKDILREKDGVNIFQYTNDMQTIIQYVPSIVKIQLINRNGIRYQFGNDIRGWALDGNENEDVYDMLMEKNLYDYWAPRHYGHVLEAGSFDKEKMVTSYYRRMIDEAGNSRGVIAIHIDEEIFAKSYTLSVEDNQVWITNHSNQVVSQSRSAGQMEFVEKDFEELENSTDIIFENSFLSTSVRMYTVRDLAHGLRLFLKRKMTTNSIQVLLVLGIVGFLFFMFCAIFMYANRRYVILPLDRLMVKVNRGENLEIPLDEYEGSEDEVHILAQKFRSMMLHINELIDSVYIEKIKTQEAEQNAMLAQINPHFLYNTLDSIKWNALRNKDKDVAYQLEALAVMLRGTLNFGNNYTTIDNEMSIIENYCYLIQARFRKDIQVQIDVTPGIGQIQVPKLIIQPLVENAFKHGLENKVGEKHMWIKIHRNSNRLVVYVFDDGIGCNQEEILRKVADKETPPDECFALRNIVERLRIEYGDTAKLQFHSKEGIGTWVKIYLPFIK